MSVEVIEQSKSGFFKKFETTRQGPAWYYEGSFYGTFDGIGQIDLYRSANQVSVFPGKLEGTTEIKDNKGRRKVKPNDLDFVTRLSELSTDNPTVTITNRRTRKRVTFRYQEPDLHLPNDELPIGITPKNPDPASLASVALEIPQQNP